MTIAQLDNFDFLERLHNVLKPSKPIDSIEQLWGRKKQLQELEVALHADGRHAFILGDRGVGKSSLAQTAAHLLQSSDNQPIIVSCDYTSTLTGIISAILNEALASIDISERSHKIAFKPPLLSFEFSEQLSNKPSLPEVIDPLTATMALDSLSKWHSEKTIIVIDEFDQMPDDQRKAFGVLLKQLGDKGSKVKLIFTGIGQSLDSLMDGHLSSFRQLHQVKLDVLPWDGRFKIIETAFNEFNIKLPEDIRYKIAGLSDGFPSYVHLICEKILVAAHFSDDPITEINFSLFLQALDDAINSVSEILRKSYDQATDGKPEYIHHILWAMADSADLIRSYEHITFSYSDIVNQLELEALDEDKFKKEFAKLRKKSYGCILKRAFDNRPGWFAFRENVIRGFIRMCAEKSNVQLDFERYFTAHTASARTVGTQRKYQPLTEVERNVEYLKRKD